MSVAAAVSAKLGRRSDYTQKYNTSSGRHGWLRLTPAYSLKVVEELLEKCDQPVRVYDPFSGTGTTALSAAYHGHEGVATDINPFLVWLGNAKTDNYSAHTIATASRASAHVAELLREGGFEPAPPPAIHNVERWWDVGPLAALCKLKAAIDAATLEGSQERTLLLVAFCRTVIKVSNAAFNHQSLSFKVGRQIPINFGSDVGLSFAEELEFVLCGARDNPPGSGRVLRGDSRTSPKPVGGLFDLVITSPPYANRMSYIRELRPYMYWLGFLENGSDAGELDWAAIGGTWGIATSRLNGWTRDPTGFDSMTLLAAIESIESADNKNGILLGKYIQKYFDDIWAHLKSMTEVLAPSARLHYIVGNSTFYGTLLETEVIYTQMFRSLGFNGVHCKAIRKRNSKKELIEFEVSGIWPQIREV